MMSILAFDSSHYPYLVSVYERMRSSVGREISCYKLLSSREAVDSLGFFL